MIDINSFRSMRFNSADYCDLMIDIQRIVETKFGVKIRFVVNISLVCVTNCQFSMNLGMSFKMFDD